MRILRIYVDDPESIRGLLGPDLQIVSVRCVEEVLHAVQLSIRAFKRGTNHARSLGGEILLRLAGTAQISEAIKKVGLSRGLNYAILLGDVELPPELKVVDPERCNENEAELKESFERMALVEVI
ncbi:MAG: hypothetical protein GXO14_04040 [Thermococci archaeon]|nr:hypothetical protein [Thermococci archaeon]